jgi:hypothetical protein
MFKAKDVELEALRKQVKANLTKAPIQGALDTVEAIAPSHWKIQATTRMPGVQAGQAAGQSVGLGLAQAEHCGTGLLFDHEGTDRSCAGDGSFEQDDHVSHGL